MKNGERKNFYMKANMIMDSGIYARMLPRHRAVYEVLCRYADNNTGIAYPSVATISKMGGVNKNLISKTTNELESATLIDKTRAGERLGFRNQYRVRKDEEIDVPRALAVFRERSKPPKFSKGEDGKFESISKSSEGVHSS